MPTLEDATAQATALVRSYCRWHVSPSQSETLALDGPGGSVLLLPSLHVTSVTAVVNDGTAIDAGAYDWSQAGMIELRSGCFTRRLRGVSVTLMHGHMSMPDEVQSVIDRLSSRAVSDPGIIQQVGQVRYATSLTQGASVGMSLTDYDREALAPYRIPSRP